MYVYVFPFDRPVTVVEWVVPPVVVKGVLLAYGALATVPYRQLALLFVVNPRVACVVPDGRIPVGHPFDRTGGVVSGPVEMVAKIENRALMRVAAGKVAGQVPNVTEEVLYPPCPAAAELKCMLLTLLDRPFVLYISQ